MLLSAKVRELPHLIPDNSIHPQDVFLFTAIPHIGNILQIEVSNIKTNYKRVIEEYEITKRVFHNVLKDNNECFDNYKFDFQMVVTATNNLCTYEKLLLDCKFDFKNHEERKNWCEYGRVEI